MTRGVAEAALIAMIGPTTSSQGANWRCCLTSLCTALIVRDFYSFYNSDVFYNRYSSRRPTMGVRGPLPRL